MTNREKLNSECMYDLLCRMHDNVSNVLKEETICYLDIVTGDHDEPCRAKTCQECLQKWLNEEVKT